jgi:hypothetical protein
LRPSSSRDSTSTDGRSWAITKVMPFHQLRNALAGFTLALLFAVPCVPAFAQNSAFLVEPENNLPENPQPVAVEPVVAVKPVAPAVLPETHKFWDNENKILFTAVAASSAADFAVTYQNLHDGGRELNPVTRLFAGSTAGLAANFAGETAGVIGLSYFFHKTGHHRLERIVSMGNIGASSFAVGYDLAHR